MKHPRLLVMAAAVTLAATAAEARNCAERATVVERLETKYAEQLIARGLQNRNALMEIFASQDMGTYTVLITTPKGVSCVVGAGTDLMLEEIKGLTPGTAG